VGYQEQPPSPPGQGAAKALTVLEAVETAEVFWILLSGLDVQIDEERTVFV
jgi:hypothetical protein